MSDVEEEEADPSTGPSPTYTAKDYQDHIAFRERFHDILAADTVDPDDNTILRDGHETNSEIVVFNEHFYNKDGLQKYFISQLARNLQEMQQKQSNLERKIRNAGQDHEKIQQLLRAFPKDKRMMIRDQWSQTDVDTKVDVKHTSVPAWSDSTLAQNWARDHVLDQVWANSVRLMTADELSELQQGYNYFDEEKLIDYEIMERTRAAENASPIVREEDVDGGILEVRDTNTTSGAPDSGTAATLPNRPGSRQATRSSSHRGRRKPIITLNEEDPIQAQALKQIMQAASLGDPDSPDDNPLTGFHTTLLNGNIEKWFRKMTPVWFSHELGGFLSRYELHVMH